MADPPFSCQISDELGLPVGSIGPTVVDARRELRMLLQPPDEGESIKVTVVGLGYVRTVTAACLASAGAPRLWS
jgi:hypothetical protein